MELRVKQASVLLLLGLVLYPAFPGVSQTLSSSERAAPQTALTIEQARELADNNSPEIRAAQRRVASAQSKVATAASLDDPMFTYRDWGTPLTKPWDLNQAQNMFMVQQTFPGKGKRELRSAIAGKEVEAEKSALESVRQDVSARVRKSFIDLIRNADEMRLHEKQAELLREALSAAMAKYTVGKVPQADVLRAQIVLARLSDHMIELEQERDLARAELNTLLGREPSTPTEVIGTYRTTVALPVAAEMQRIALEHRPEFEGLRSQVSIAGTQGRLARLASKPDFTVAAGYMIQPAGSPFRNGYMAEFGINLPLLNRQKHTSEAAQADAQIEVTRADLEVAESMVFLQIQQSLIKARSAQRSMKLYSDTLTPEAEATFQAALAAYQNDRTDFLNLIDSQNMLLDIRSSYYKAAGEFDSQLADLERATGAPLPEPIAQTPAKEDK
jgi:outer membrane protein, heavy metal efflux system